MKTIKFGELQCMGSVSHTSLADLRGFGCSKAQSVTIIESDEQFNIFSDANDSWFLIDEFSDSPEGHFEVQKDGELVAILVEGLED